MGHALVIGASGGIGAALADQLAQAHTVTRISRSEDGLDVADDASVATLMAPVQAPVDLAFMATGILAPPGGAPEKTLDALDARAMAQVFAVNTIGPALVLKHLMGKLAADARVGVLTARVGSIGDNKLGGWYSYRAAKAAANQIAHGAAIEIRRKHKQSITVALHPGTVATPFTEGYKAPKVAPQEAATNLIAVLTGLTLDQNGGFFDYAGEAIPW